MKSRRIYFQLVVIYIGLMAMVGSSYFYLSSCREAAESAAIDLRQCEQLATRIQSLRQRPAVAGSHTIQAADLSKQIEDAVKLTKIETQSLIRITPASPRRVGESAYQEVPTEILLQRVTLRQLVEFLGHLSATGSGLSANSMHLSAPREADEGEKWNVQATVSYLVYSPRSGLSGGGSD